MTKTAKQAGISREGLYKALSPNGNPSFDTVCKILNAIDTLSCLLASPIRVKLNA